MISASLGHVRDTGTAAEDSVLRTCHSVWLALISLAITAVAASPCVAAELGKGPPAEQATPDRMAFTVFQPCRGSASFCAPQILATGEIDPEAPERLRSFLGGYPHKPTIIFDSPGGSLKAGLQLGLLIREAGLSTRVAPEVRQELTPSADGITGFEVLARDAGCYSACAFAFMGGVSRTIEQGGKLGVHQFYGGEGESAESSAQVVTAMLSQYVSGMGVGRDVLDVAGFTDSSTMTLISREDAITYNLDNQHPPLAQWRLEPMEDGSLAVVVDQQMAGSDRVTRVAMMKHPTDSNFLVMMLKSTLDGTVRPAEARAALAASEAIASICVASDQCINGASLGDWEYSAERHDMTAGFIVNGHEFVSLLQSPSNLFVTVPLPNAYAHLAPDVEVGKKGLRNAMLAVYKQ